MGQTSFSGPVVSQNGFVENSFTTAQRDAIPNPTAGLLIYNTTTNTYQVYNGSTWQTAFGGGPAPTTYTLAVDYYDFATIIGDPGTGNQLTIDTTSGNWITTGWQNIIAKTSGTSFTFVFDGDPAPGTIRTGTLTSGFVETISGVYVASVNYSPSATGITNPTLTYITI